MLPPLVQATIASPDAWRRRISSFAAPPSPILVPARTALGRVALARWPGSVTSLRACARRVSREAGRGSPRRRRSLAARVGAARADRATPGCGGPRLGGTEPFRAPRQNRGALAARPRRHARAASGACVSHRRPRLLRTWRAVGVTGSIACGVEAARNGSNRRRCGLPGAACRNGRCDLAARRRVVASRRGAACLPAPRRRQDRRRTDLGPSGVTAWPVDVAGPRAGRRARGRAPGRAGSGERLLEHHELEVVAKRRAEGLVAVGEGLGLAGWNVAAARVPGEEVLALADDGHAKHLG